MFTTSILFIGTASAAQSRAAGSGSHGPSSRCASKYGEARFLGVDAKVVVTPPIYIICIFVWRITSEIYGGCQSDFNVQGQRFRGSFRKASGSG
jgi:hypothetical protein